MAREINLKNFYEKFKDDADCAHYLELLRWHKDIKCPWCKAKKPYRYITRDLYKCRGCGKQFTARTGTIFEDSRLSLRKWFLAIYLACALEKGVSSVQLSKYLGITQKSSWLMLQRIRAAIDKSLARVN